MFNESKKPSKLLWLEIAWLFACLPASLLLPISPWIKLCLVLSGLLYCGYQSKKMGLFKRKQLMYLGGYAGSRMIWLRFILFIVISTILVAIYLPKSLFSVLFGNPLLWLGICIFYAVFSVYPQEFLYRVFFFKRYSGLVANNQIFITLNAILFCMAHLVFLNSLVFLLTFIGGVLFALTYQKSRSLLLTSLEHSAYGLWLFTLGLGEMLAFPGS
ncbi:CPBP family intramembrane glutamic endopeptidase [uncultured Paraglaciecola sp.]|uniref:CPBP family intramembrane glutamic endopeptidase n=1 Tax=uncultured Paraglaciecola sp. TaxID=1765024 RepID=UPI00259ACCA4|nr:CPBP family intramembrane glutamic endopeptidase [uncultured Paraglaciecola sp.]